MMKILKKILSLLKRLFLFPFRHWKWTLGIILIVGILVAIFVTVFVIRSTKDLPSIETLKSYKPPVMSRVHAGDGKLISEFKKEARVFVPIETVPKALQHAFVAAEDQRFYKHDGFDEKGFARAMVANIGHVIRDERLEGGSTITQQVAKRFKVGDARTVERKVREMVIARRIEKALTKDKILELYLNENYFGRGAYGVAAASLNYFNKPMKELDLAEIAYLAVLPKGPANYQVGNPAKKKRALRRRNYVLTRMVEDGYATADAAKLAKEQDIIVTKRFEGEEYLAAEYFVEEARKQIFKMYGENELYEGGLSIRTTLDTRLQLAGRKALRSGLEAYDRRRGYRGALAQIDGFDDWKVKLNALKTPRDIGDWRVALVLSTDKTEAKLGFADKLTQFPNADIDTLTDEEKAVYEAKRSGILRVKDIQWASKPKPNGKKEDAPKIITEVVKAGDVILVARQNVKAEIYNLRQIPNVNGGLIAMDPHTGRVLALVGGYSFEQSQYNRATQARRQPGSAFKPFVYAAALDEGYTPATQVLDAPFVIERQDSGQCREVPMSADQTSDDQDLESQASANQEGTPQLRTQRTKLVKIDSDGNIVEDEKCELFYKPANYNEGKFYGLQTLRFGLEKSKNAMTVRMANDIGMSRIRRYGEDLGIYDDVRAELAWALGAGETTMVRLSAAYASLVNGGKVVTPTILDRVQDGTGKTIFIHGDKTCAACAAEEWDGSAPPNLPDERNIAIDPVTAYQVTYMLKGVVDNGTGRSIKVLGRPLGGKTGTTNDYKDAWFMGFSPDLVTGVYVGYDTPRPLAGEAGGKVAAPIFRDFMREALKDAPIVPFRIPEGVTLAPVDRTTGEPSYIGAPNFILEAFRAGNEPQIGDLSSTIRIGSGGDSFFGSDYVPKDYSEDDYLDEAPDSEEAAEPEGEKNALDKMLDNAEDALSNEVSDEDVSGNEATNEALKKAPIKQAPRRVPPPAPKEPEPAEDELDDGLY